MGVGALNEAAAAAAPSPIEALGAGSPAGAGGAGVAVGAAGLMVGCAVRSVLLNKQAVNKKCLNRAFIFNYLGEKEQLFSNGPWWQSITKTLAFKVLL